jgi:hypothetical protein
MQLVGQGGWVFRVRQGQRLFVLFVGIGRRAAARSAVLDAFKGARIEDSCGLSAELSVFLNLYEGRIVKLPVMDEWPPLAGGPRRIGLRTRLRLAGRRRAAAAEAMQASG